MEFLSKTTVLKSGETCAVRRPEASDAERLLRYQKESSGETPYLVAGPEDIGWTVEEQAARIVRWNDSPSRLRLIAEVDGGLAGAAVLYPVGTLDRLRHRCCVDITLYKRFCGKGIGTLLLRELLSAAKAAGYEQAELEVVSTNAPAVALYRKLGFEAVGTLPQAMKYKDRTYASFLLMVRRLA